MENVNRIVITMTNFMSVRVICKNEIVLGYVNFDA